MHHPIAIDPPNRSTVTHPNAVRLPHLAVVDAHGPDAGSFLQGQLTQDVLSMTPGEARGGGFCSAKGRLLANFIIVRLGEQAWRLVTHAGVAEALAKRLKMFVLRAKCTVQARTDLMVVGHGGAELRPWSVRQGTAAAESQDTEVGIGWWGGRCLSTVRVQDQAGASVPESDGIAAVQAWQHADIVAGWPWIEAATVEQFVPQMVNLEVLGAVNFRKGCYPGQEVVARSQYRGTLKRRMALLTAAVSAPAAGSEVFHSGDPGQPAGMVVNAAPVPGSHGAECALLVELKLAAMDGGSLHLGDAQGPVLSLGSLPYRIPTESEM